MTPPFFYRASLLLNLALALTAGVLLMRWPERTAARSDDTAFPENNGHPTPLQSNRTKAIRENEAEPSSSRDRRKQMQQLRAAGISDDVLAKVVIAECDSRWKRRMNELRERSLRGLADDSETTAMMDDWNREKEADLRALLGEEGFRKWDASILLADMNLDRIELTTAETSRLYDLRKALQKRTLELEGALRDGSIDPADFEARREEARVGFENQLQEVLGEERLATTRGKEVEHTDLRRKLTALNASDSQMRNLQEFHRQWDDQRAAYEESVRTDPTGAQNYDEFSNSMEQARDKAYQEILGTEAYEKLRKQEDLRYSQMKQYASAWGMTDQHIDQIYDAIKSYENSIQEQQAQARALETGGQSVDWDGLERAREQFAEQTRLSLRNYLGEELFGKLKQNGIFPFEE